MKKVFKIILIVLLFLMLIIVIDTIQAKVFDNSPILNVKEKFNDYYINKGIFVNYYHCSNDEQKTTWKNTKYSCPVKSNEDVVVKSNEDVVVTTDITLSIKENTLTNSKATLVLKNNYYKELPRLLLPWNQNALVTGNVENLLISDNRELLDIDIKANKEINVVNSDLRPQNNGTINVFCRIKGNEKK